MTARAMDSFGLSKLFIVNPRAGWPSKLAENSAKQGKKIIKKIKIFNSLNDAVSKFNVVIATTNRKRFLTKKTFNNFNDLNKKNIDFNNTAILFGPENSGLSNKDLRLANYIYTIKTASINKSLNLSHAVSLISYQLFNYKKIKNSFEENNEQATKKDLLNFLNSLINDLDSLHFFNPI